MNIGILLVLSGTPIQAAAPEPTFHATTLTVEVRDIDGLALPGAHVVVCPPVGNGYVFLAGSNGNVECRIPTSENGLAVEFSGFAGKCSPSYPFEPDGAELVRITLEQLPLSKDPNAAFSGHFQRLR